MNRRVVGILIILLVIIAAIFGLAYFFLGDGGNPFAPEPTAVPTVIPVPVIEGQPTEIPIVTVAAEQNVQFVEVVVSNNTIPRGFQLTESELQTEMRLADQISPNMITDINDAIGLFTRKSIFQGETLTIEALVSDLRQVGQEDFGPSSLIPPGFVAMSIPFSREHGVGSAIAAGDSIDILISFLLLPVDEQFQTRLHNNSVIYLTKEIESTDADGNTIIETIQVPFLVEPQGRYEELPTGDLANVAPSEKNARGQHVAFVIQNARVIEVGKWIPPVPPMLPTPTLSPEEEESGESATEDQTSLSGLADAVNETIALLSDPLFADTILVALPPQQQVFLKYAIETNSVVDFALRGEGDGQLYAVENVSLEYILDRFNIEIPPNFTYVVDTDDNTFRPVDLAGVVPTEGGTDGQ
ncbi:MAG: Flp pilus assembly protein CpaB [Cellvibrionaceae bacterium]|jgi:Flp pilus assembly protein CpaB